VGWNVRRLFVLWSISTISFEEMDTMTWKQIKEAVEEAGVEDDEEIRLIECENGDGDGIFHKMRLGKALKLTENTLPSAKDSSGCAVMTSVAALGLVVVNVGT
jgi:hypothetical protein